MTQNDIAPGDWRELKIDGFVALIGPLLRSTHPDERNIYGLQTHQKHENHIGIIHGGVLTGILDQVIAITAWNAADRHPTVTVQMETRFFGAARVGDFLEIRPSIRHATHSLIFVDADITCGAKIIASASSVMKISKQSGLKQ
ncbi:PaaI family thioesterase [Pseudogemmobacter sp. W21_MBD1_M6]|uniref:PaaI family thioesterase n=1 Tax=Pseudogemmobacter sp. W21_MBD1_M6 TaxID=3240271 RepID=UPI003F94A2F6